MVGGLHRRRRAVRDREHREEPRPPIPRDKVCPGSARAARHCAGARGGGSCWARTALRGRCVPEQVGKDPEKLLHLLRLERKQKLCIHGKGTPRRSYLHVSDAAEAYEKVLFYGEVGQVYNVGTKDEISVLEVAKALLKCYGLEKEEKKWNMD